jgi:hypothetical protein
MELLVAHAFHMVCSKLNLLQRRVFRGDRETDPLCVHGMKMLAFWGLAEPHSDSARTGSKTRAMLLYALN